MRKKKPSNKPLIISLIASVLVGAAIGIVKFIFDDIIGFSLIIIFPLFYGIAVGFVLSRIFIHFGLAREKLAMLLAVVSITTAILTFLNLERSYLERIALEELAKEGEDITGLSLPWLGYFNVISEVGTEVGFIVGPGLPLTGFWFYGLMILEFGLMYFFAIQKMQDFHPKVKAEA